MTTPPLPETACVRVRLGYTTTSGTEMGSRFYLSYSGSAPTSANCDTLGTDIGTAWASNISPVVYVNIGLAEVDVLDIASNSGNFGTVAVSHAGSMTGGTLTSNAATNVEFDIARRYRGGKPRMFLPPPDDTSLTSQDKFTAGFIAAVNTAVEGFFSDIEALTVGSMGTLAHVNVSYYSGFTNVTNSSGRTRAAPKYRTPTAKVDTITGYACKAVVGSQRRRRTATTY
jgi:hypothetical protein